MSNTSYQHKRTTTTGTAPTTSDISTGQIALNLTDRRAFTSNGTVTFDLIANVSGNFAITNNSTGAYFVGNSTVNAVVNSTSIKIMNSTSNAFLTIPTTGQWSATNYFLHANGTWVQVTAGGGTPGGSNTYVQFNDSTAFGGSAGFTYDKTTNTISLGNSTINAVVNSTSVKIMNSTSNSTFSIPTTTQWAGNFFLHANGTWATPVAAAAPAGSNTQIQFNDSGSAGASANLTWNNANFNLTVGNSTINVSSNSTLLVFSNSTVTANLGLATGLKIGGQTVNSTAFYGLNYTSVYVANSAPGSPANNMLWWKSDEGTMKIYYADSNTVQWVDTYAGYGSIPANWGKQSIWIPASAMTTRATNGANVNSFETSTNKINYNVLEFDASVNNHVQFAMRMPKSWNEGTVTASFVWSHPSTATNFGVTWSLEAVAVRDSVAIDTAFGTPQTVVSTGGATDTVYISTEISALTVAGTPQAQDYVYFQIKRLPADASDTMAVVARLHGLNLFITTDAATDS